MTCLTYQAIVEWKAEILQEVQRGNMFYLKEAIAKGKNMKSMDHIQRERDHLVMFRNKVLEKLERRDHLRQKRKP